MTFDTWITARISFRVVTPAAGNTGDFDNWITVRIAFPEFVTAAAIPPAAVLSPFYYLHLLRGAPL